MRARGTIAMTLVGATLVLGCGREEAAPPETGIAVGAPVRHRSNVPPLDPTNIVSIARGSEDHTTLVAAIEAADYVTSVAASGPLTVFAPTDAAFDALPPGALEDLLRPENVDKLRKVLQYHVTTSALGLESFRDGQTLGMANGAKATIRVEEHGVTINGAEVLASIPASNGMVHVIDAVLLPPAE